MRLAHIRIDPTPPGTSMCPGGATRVESFKVRESGLFIGGTLLATLTHCAFWSCALWKWCVLTRPHSVRGRFIAVAACHAGESHSLGSRESALTGMQIAVMGLGASFKITLARPPIGARLNLLVLHPLFHTHTHTSTRALLCGKLLLATSCQLIYFLPPLLAFVAVYR